MFSPIIGCAVASSGWMFHDVLPIHEGPETSGVREIVKRLIVVILENISANSSCAIALFVQIHDNTNHVRLRASSGCNNRKGDVETKVNSTNSALSTNTFTFSNALSNQVNGGGCDYNASSYDCIINSEIMELQFAR